MTQIENVFMPLRARIGTTTAVQHLGHVHAVAGNAVQITGLSHMIHLGDEVEILIPSQKPLRAEITRLGADTATAVPFAPLTGIPLKAPVRWIGLPRIAPDRSWLGRVINPFGEPLDRRPLWPGADTVTLSAPPPPAHTRRPMGDRIETGLPVMDMFLPLARGQRIGLFAGSGVGKSTLLGSLARHVETDVTVVALIGERGREVGEFLHTILGEEALKRTVVIVATSDQAPGIRRKAIELAITVAEFFRDQGAHVLFLADSITRFAEAHREVAVASGEAANLNGFPSSLTHALAQIVERAGPGGTGATGDITAVFSVLVAGSDMEEPVADILRGLIDGHVVLSRSIAERGRYPAIDVLRSVSRALPGVATPEENTLLTQARHLLSTYERAELMIQSGLYVSGSDLKIDAAIRAQDKLDGLFGQPGPQSIEESFSQLHGILELKD